MMKKFLILFLICFINLFSQSEQQSIELPDFVITGKQSIEVQLAQKPKIELISILSKDFFTPKYSTEELPLFFISEPVQKLPSIKLSQDYFTGKLNFMLGRYTFPLGELFLTKSFDNYLFNLNVWGNNLKEYLPYSGYNNSGITLNNDFHISTKSGFLPGTKINLSGTYFRDSYNLYGSNLPSNKRETNYLTTKFSLANNYINYFHFGFDIDGNVYKINSDNFKSVKINSNSFAEISLKDFNLGGKLKITNETINDDLKKERSYNFLDIIAFVKITPFNFLNVESGLNFNTNSKYNFFSPFAFGELKFDNNLSLSLLFNPHVEYISTYDFINKNNFADLTIDNSFVKYKNDLKLNFKFDYKKSFSNSITFNLAQIDNYVYYEDVLLNRNYSILTRNDVTKFLISSSLYLYNNIYGNLFSEISYQIVEDPNNKTIPFEPNWKINFEYSYNFQNGLNASIGYLYFGKYYSDLMNKNKFDNYSNLSIGFSYELLYGLKFKIDFQNILNRSNFVWHYYKEKPFDYIAGIEYRW